MDPYARTLPRASGIVLYCLLLLMAAAVFWLWPQLDLLVSGYAREFSGGSFQSQDGWWGWLYYGTRPAVLGTALVVLLLGLASWALGRPLLGITPRRALFLLLAFAVVQGLVVDLYLKNVFGRARPRTIEEFGGDLTFTPFYLVTDQCRRNCSFVSGHAAMAFSSFAFVYLVAPRWRWKVFLAALLLGSVTGWMRILQGGHFLSDVVFSGLVVYGMTWLLALLILEWRWPPAWSGRFWSGGFWPRHRGG